MSVKLMDNILCNELPVPFLLFYRFIFYNVRPYHSRADIQPYRTATRVIFLMYIIYKTGHPVLQYLDFGLGLVTVEQKAMMMISGKGDL